MATIVRIRQAKQARNSEAYDDTKAAGTSMETDPVNIEEDLNNIRSQLRRIIDPDGKWYDVPLTDLSEILDLASRRYNQDVTGAINGTNTTFTVSPYFRHDGIRDEALYLNGQRLKEGSAFDYEAVESGGVGTGYDTIEICFPPKTGDVLSIDFTPA